MASNPQIQFGVTMRDYSAEPSTFTLYTAAPEDLVAGLSVAMVDLMTAIGDVTLGLVTNEKASEVKKLTNVRIGSGNREDKIEIAYQDNTTLELFQVDLPTRDNTLLPVAGTDFYPIGAAPWANLKTKFEAGAVSPNGNAVTVISFRLVGRNN